MDEIVIFFYNTFSNDISNIKTIEQKNAVLSRMQETFQEALRNKPSLRNELSEIYQDLKCRCEGAV